MTEEIEGFNITVVEGWKRLFAEVGSAIFFGGALSLECYLLFYVR